MIFPPQQPVATSLIDFSLESITLRCFIEAVNQPLKAT